MKLIVLRGIFFQKSFEWFLELLGDMESAQIEEGGGMDKLLDFHLYFTAALQRTDMRAVGLQLAMDLIHRKVNLTFKAAFCKENRCLERTS